MIETMSKTVPTVGQESLMRFRAARLRQNADRLTERRRRWSPVVGAAIALTSSKDTLASTIVAAGLTYLHDTDRRDGNDGRESARLLGESTPVESQAADHLADKKLFYCTMGGLTIRAVREQNYVRAAAYGALTAGSAVRDYVNVRERKQAASEGLNAASRNIGRIKTAVFAGASTLLASPLGASDMRTGQIGDAGLVVVGALSAASHIDMHRSIEQQRQQALTPVAIAHE